jgi:hypothetical protein
MAHIFISYARADRPRAERLAQALERTGWSVWWDREIPPGRSFDEVIEEALSQARCVIVLWSDASIRSEWVKTEAAEAAQRRILVPILTDGARIPLEFRRIQAAAIDDWRDLEANEGWGHLCDAVAALVESPRRAAPAPAVAPARRAGRRWMPAVAVALLVVAGAGYVATRPRTPVATRPAATPVTEAPALPALPAPAPSAPVASVVSDPPARVKPPAFKAQSAIERPVRPTTSTHTNTPVAPPGDAVARAAVPTAAPEPLPIETAVAATRMANRLEHAPRDTTAATFDVTLLYGVFRDQAGRLSVSPTGVRFSENGGNRRAFELSCGSLRRVATATMIADREQRLLELTSNEQAYRVRASDTGARDSIRDAIGRMCGR